MGGPIIIVLMALFFRLFVRAKLIDAAREQALKGVAGSMEGHAAMDMSVQGEGSFAKRLLSDRGLTSVSHIFVMEWAAVIRDIVIGLLIAGAVAAWVPDSFWQTLFLTDHAGWSKVWGPLVGPIIAILSFVCSIGNVPLAAVLYSGGISFGGVVSFLFADLIIVPILIIYRKYYGTRMMLTLLAGFYVTMVLGGYARRDPLRRPRSDPRRRPGAGRGAGRHLELHDHPEHRRPGAGGRSCWSASTGPAAGRCCP